VVYSDSQKHPWWPDWIVATRHHFHPAIDAIVASEPTRRQYPLML
jgi:hypothetical protein